MCILCCCCSICNSFSSKCIEICILLLSSITFIFSISDIIVINLKHLTTPSFLLLMILVIFSMIITIGALFILICRFRGIINKKRNSMGICLARIGLFISILSFIISIITESMVQSNFYVIDHPCINYSYNNKNYTSQIYKNYIGNYSRLLENDFCINKDKSYNAKICEEIEYAMIYLSSTFIEFCSFLLIFLWYNDLKRIKEKIDGNLLVNESPYLNKNRLVVNRHKSFAFRNGERKFNDVQFDSVNRYFNQNHSIRSNIILVKNNNNNNNKQRFSQPINLYFIKDSRNKNFIRNLREEMKKGISSIDEEEDSCENKEIENKPKQNLKNSISNNNDNIKNEKNDNNKIENNNENNNNKDNDNNNNKIDDNNTNNNNKDIDNIDNKTQINNINKKDNNNNNDNNNNSLDKDDIKTNIEENKENLIVIPDVFIK